MAITESNILKTLQISFTIILIFVNLCNILFCAIYRHYKFVSYIGKHSMICSVIHWAELPSVSIRPKVFLTLRPLFNQKIVFGYNSVILQKYTWLHSHQAHARTNILLQFYLAAATLFTKSLYVDRLVVIWRPPDKNIFLTWH